MSTISSMIPPDLEEDELKRIYNSFVVNHSKAYSYVTDQIYNVAHRFLEDEDSTEEKLEDLVLQVAVSANIFKLITEWIAARTVETEDK